MITIYIITTILCFLCVRFGNKRVALYGLLILIIPQILLSTYMIISLITNAVTKDEINEIKIFSIIYESNTNHSHFENNKAEELNEWIVEMKETNKNFFLEVLVNDEIENIENIKIK